MPHLRSILSSPRAGLAVRIAAAAALIVGLLGMHVLLAPASHGAHGAASVDVSAMTMTSVDVEGRPHHAKESTAATSVSIPGSPAERRCTAACGSAPESGPGGSLHTPESGVWTVVCVLALLLTAFLVVRRGRAWQLPRRWLGGSSLAALPTAKPAPRHPASLIELSISRT